MEKKFCEKCKKILRSENNSGFCSYHKYYSKWYKKSHKRYLKKWRGKNNQKYLAYQRQYRLKKKLSLENANTSLNSG